MRKLGILVLLTAALAGGLVANDGLPTARAQQACGFTNDGVEICLSLDPETATNPVGTDHTVTGTASWDGGPMPDLDTFLTGYRISVESGPNAGKFLGGQQVDANSQLSFTYTGDGGPGIDTIQFCLFLASGGTGGCTSFVDPVVASKEWTAAPTMTVPPPIAAATSTVPPPIATATSAPTSNGGNPADGSSGYPWWALAIAAAIGLLGSLAVGSAYWRGRTRQT